MEIVGGEGQACNGLGGGCGGSKDCLWWRAALMSGKSSSGSQLNYALPTRGLPGHVQCGCLSVPFCHYHGTLTTDGCLFRY